MCCPPRHKRGDSSGRRPTDRYFSKVNVAQSSISASDMSLSPPSPLRNRGSSTSSAILDWNFASFSNKGAVMVLPHGINKATGLTAALARLELSPHNTVAIGDGGDHAMLALSEYGVAPMPSPCSKGTADRTTAGDHGGGIGEIIDHLSWTIWSRQKRTCRGTDCYGTSAQRRGSDAPFGREIFSWPVRPGRKVHLATGLLERLGEQGINSASSIPKGVGPMSRRR